MNPITHFVISVRLVGGSSESEGRVELFHGGTWGTVCDDSWDIRDASVICRSLGYAGAIAATTEANFGEGTGRIFLDEVDCSGSETSIFDCSSSGIENHDCVHAEDAGVRCMTGKVHNTCNNNFSRLDKVSCSLNVVAE